MELPDLGLDEVQLKDQYREAHGVWRNIDGQDRKVFGIDFGQFAHERYQEDIIRQEELRGRSRNSDYGIEYELGYPDGGAVRYDYVDFQNHTIFDFKPVKPEQTEADIAKRYKEQRQHHNRCLRHTFWCRSDI
jgi:hypothetical protein